MEKQLQVWPYQACTLAAFLVAEKVLTPQHTHARTHARTHTLPRHLEGDVIRETPSDLLLTSI